LVLSHPSTKQEDKTPAATPAVETDNGGDVDGGDDGSDEDSKSGFWKKMIGGSSVIDDGEPHKPSVSLCLVQGFGSRVWIILLEGSSVVDDGQPHRQSMHTHAHTLTHTHSLSHTHTHTYTHAHTQSSGSCQIVGSPNPKPWNLNPDCSRCPTSSGSCRLSASAAWGLPSLLTVFSGPEPPSY
jgi:hypothetical protein